MTYPDDVLKAAREAAATDEENRAEAEKAAGNLAGHSWRLARARGYRNGKYDSEEKVAAACIAIMAGPVLSGFNDGDGADVEAVLETTCAEEQASKRGLWDADNADYCEGCGNGDKVPANGYWRCPKCDAEWPGDEG